MAWLHDSACHWSLCHGHYVFSPCHAWSLSGSGANNQGLFFRGPKNSLRFFTHHISHPLSLKETLWKASKLYTYFIYINVSTRCQLTILVPGWTWTKVDCFYSHCNSQLAKKWQKKLLPKWQPRVRHILTCSYCLWSFSSLKHSYKKTEKCARHVRGKRERKMYAVF